MTIDNDEILKRIDTEQLNTWICMAAFVRFLILNSFLAIIALSPACKVVADNRIAKYAFLATYCRNFF